MMNDNDGDVLLYLTEAEQGVLTLDRLLSQAESSGAMGIAETAELFRLVHTLKGASAMMQYSALENTSHLLEEILSALRKEGGIAFTRENRQVLNVGFEYSACFLEQLERIKTGKEVIPTVELDEKLRTLAASMGVTQSDGEVAARNTVVAEVVRIPEGSSQIHVSLRKCPMPHIRCGLVVKSARSMCASQVTSPAEFTVANAEIVAVSGFDIYFIPNDGVSAAQIAEKLAAQPFVESAKEVAAKEKSRAVQPESMVHIAQSKVNSLIAVLDELVTAQSALAEALNAAGQSDSRTERLMNQLRRDANQAKALSAEMGMVEIGGVFNQMRRLVRSMARESERDIAVVTDGNEVLVDGSVIETISDALIHIVRNGVDHGIEPQEVRLAAGKSAEGTITLSAKKENGMISISVTDDGGGIDREAILKKAAAKGLIEGNRTTCSDSELLGILSASGFSTNTAVTKYSGRGVGLDTAAKRIRDVQGGISLESFAGQGSTFKIRIPVTLSVRNVLAADIEGSSVMLPVSAVGTVAFVSQAVEREGVVNYRGDEYRRLRFNKIDMDRDSGGDVYIFLPPDLGRYCIRAESVGAIVETLLIPLPQYISDSLGGDNIFAGCCIDKTGNILCVPDIYRLIAVNENKLER